MKKTARKYGLFVKSMHAATLPCVWEKYLFRKKKPATPTDTKAQPDEQKHCDAG